MAPTQTLHALLDQTSWIHALARQLVADPHLAADLAQDTTIDALEQRPDGSRPLRGWLATVMRNKLTKLRRGERNRSARESSVRTSDLAPAALEVVEKAETHRNVVLAVLALEEPYRSTLLMRFFEQLSYDEIARRMGVTRASVNSRVTRGLVQLRQRLENSYGDRRALCLALTSLAKLPTGVATTTTILGLKTMHVAIGTAAAATLLATTASVGLLGREPSEPTSSRLTPAFVPAIEEVELQVPLTMASETEPEPVATARTPLAVQREQRQERREDDQNVWRTELSRNMALTPGLESMNLNTGSGDIRLEPSLSGLVEIRSTVRARLNKVSSDRLTQVFEDHVDVREEKGVLTIEDNHKNESGWSVSFVVGIPGDLSVRANTGSGDVTIRKASGSLMTNTGSGDVSVELAQDRLETLAANTGSGDIVIEVGAIEKGLKAHPGSGDVTMHIVDGTSPGKAGMNTGSGDITLIVPPGIVGSFDLETNGDGIEVPPALGLEVVQSHGESVARGVVGNGGGSYKLRSGSGDLKIELGNALPLRDR